MITECVTGMIFSAWCVVGIVQLRIWDKRVTQILPIKYLCKILIIFILLKCHSYGQCNWWITNQSVSREFTGTFRRRLSILKFKYISFNVVSLNKYLHVVVMVFVKFPTVYKLSIQDIHTMIQTRPQSIHLRWYYKYTARLCNPWLKYQAEVSILYLGWRP